MHKILRDPLVHFLALGAVMFAAYSLLNPVDDVAGSNQIRITSGDIARFEKIYQKLWQRPPTQQELAGLVEDRASGASGRLATKPRHAIAFLKHESRFAVSRA